MKRKILIPIIVIFILILIIIVVLLKGNFHKENNSELYDVKVNKELSDINLLIQDYFSKDTTDLSNYGYNYIDEKRNAVIVGLMDDSEEKQEEFINNVFSNCCGSEYIKFIKDNSLIKFKNSKSIFEAQVLTKNDNILTVKVLKNSNQFRKNDTVVVKALKLNDEIIVGDNIKITFNGSVLTSNPPQIGTYDIEKIK